MKYLLFGLIVLTVSISSSGMNGATSCVIRQHSGSAETDDWVITVLNSFVPPFTTNIRGLDFIEPNSIFFISGTEYKLYQCKADDGSYENEWSLDPANSLPYGMANSGTYANVNDFGDMVVYYYNGSSWSTYSNPTGDDGRGMDFDGTHIWESYDIGGTYGVCAFDDSGTYYGHWVLSEIPSQPSGLAVFDPGTGNIGIAVTTYSTHNIWFYELDGSSMNYLGMGALPGGASQSLGLCYSDTRGTFF
ncbi:MAG: hypothetical protein KAT09_08645, partial [Candidatus Aegiribacteria sp.]|nr:hypothetical protein [Candidatus Aegiribacteria sp.]